MNAIEKQRMLRPSNDIYLALLEAIPDDADYLDVMLALAKLQRETAELLKVHEADD